MKTVVRFIVKAEPVDPMEELTLAISKLLSVTKLPHDLSFKRQEDFFWWDRRVGTVARHMRIEPITEGKLTGSHYGILFGQNTGSGQTDFENFDARRMGTLQETLAFFRSWMIEWAGLESMRPKG